MVGVWCSSFMLKIGWDYFAFGCIILLAHCFNCQNTGNEFLEQKIGVTLSVDL
jgi:hypothetical protein